MVKTITRGMLGRVVLYYVVWPMIPIVLATMGIAPDWFWQTILGPNWQKQIPSLLTQDNARWILTLAAVAIFGFWIFFEIVRKLRRQSTPQSIYQALDNLYAEGVEYRNELVPTHKNFNNSEQESRFEAWNNKVLDRLNEVSVAERSSFRTLNLFKPAWIPMEGKTHRQCEMESLWNEKLSRLKTIIENSK